MSTVVNRSRIALVSLLSVMLLSSAAMGGFISVDVSPLGTPPGGGPPSFVWSLLPDHSGNAQAVLNQIFGRDLPSVTQTVSGVTNSDPVLNIAETMQNTTGTTWVGYNIDLDPSGTATFTGTATSDKMTLLTQTPYHLGYGLPSPVVDGESVGFDFNILVPTTGPFSFALTQSPVLVPEPAGAALLAAGLTVLSARRRR